MSEINTMKEVRENFYYRFLCGIAIIGFIIAVFMVIPTFFAGIIIIMINKNMSNIIEINETIRGYIILFSPVYAFLILTLGILIICLIGYRLDIIENDIPRKKKYQYLENGIILIFIIVSTIYVISQVSNLLDIIIHLNNGLINLIYKTELVLGLIFFPFGVIYLTYETIKNIIKVYRK